MFSRYPSVMTMPDGNILIVGGAQQVNFLTLLRIMPSFAPKLPKPRTNHMRF